MFKIREGEAGRRIWVFEKIGSGSVFFEARIRIIFLIEVRIRFFRGSDPDTVFFRSSDPDPFYRGLQLRIYKKVGIGSGLEHPDPG